jgi:5-methylcytosine-specific restriction enzyme B
MNDFFAAEHFEMLEKWKGHRRDDVDMEQGRAYESLKSAYDLTEVWAKRVQEACFPSGSVKIRKRPTSQANTFLHYNWARIYPKPDSPVSLAYTVGIDALAGFVVKIDTVQADPQLRGLYEQIRVVFSNESPIVAILPSAEGLAKSMEELIDWSIRAIKGFRLSYEEMVERLGLKNAQQEKGDEDGDGSPISTRSEPMNRILYGPPGTGKTYETRVAALTLLGEPISEDRKEVIWRYDALSEAGQIRFVTFHPSLAYEDFVEGLRPRIEGTDSGTLSYVIRDGIFKAICKDARRNWTAWQSKGLKRSFAELWSEVEAELESGSGSLVIPTPGRRTQFNVYEIDNEVIRFRKTNGNDNHTLNAKTLEAIFEGNREVPGGLSTYYTGLSDWLKAREQGKTVAPSVSLKQFVLIIDEINRGNIPAIFGELITLLEPSKRMGQSEPLEVLLPSSQERFQVPPNLHVLGTMNTADRSVEALDVALRRRFDFFEMMPKPDLLETVDDVDLKLLLKTINARLEALVDRDHTIGHAFFMDVKALEDLRKVFSNKVLPLLQEFFYGDWNRIGLVLGKAFVTRTSVSGASLFAKDFEHEMDLPDRFALTPAESWDVAAFRSIYAA